MVNLLPMFMAASILYAIAAVATGAKAIIDPIGFSKSFGLDLGSTKTGSVGSLIDNEDAVTPRTKAILHDHRSMTMSYISLMGVRQLATGIILLTFAYRNKWMEMATILSIIGIVVAGTDGMYLSRAGSKCLGIFHYPRYTHRCSCLWSHLHKFLNWNST
jgi:Domain of unknown function (DUF4267)